MTTTTRTSTLLTPYLCVSDARRAMDWYRAVFAAQPRGPAMLTLELPKPDQQRPPADARTQPDSRGTPDQRAMPNSAPR